MERIRLTRASKDLSCVEIAGAQTSSEQLHSSGHGTTTRPSEVGIRAS